MNHACLTGTDSTHLSDVLGGFFCSIREFESFGRKCCTLSYIVTQVPCVLDMEYRDCKKYKIIKKKKLVWSKKDKVYGVTFPHSGLFLTKQAVPLRRSRMNPRLGRIIPARKNQQLPLPGGKIKINK